MSISGISSTSASTQTSSTKSIAAIKALVEELNAQSSSSSDTVTISIEALQALMKSQQQDGQQPPPMTDEMAAKMGEDIKEQNEDLFTQLDTDEDGVLSAEEAEAGKDAIGQAIKDGTLKPPEKPEGAGGPGGPPPSDSSSTDDIVAQLIAILSKQGLSNAEVAKQLGTTEQKVQEVLSAS